MYRRRGNVLYSLIEGPTPPAGRAARAGRRAGAEAPGGQGGGRSNISTGVNNTPTGLYRSDDAGATWRKVNNANPRPMYFSQVRIDPNDPEVVILGGVDLHMSTDGGKTMNTAAASKIHSDHHAIWIDPANSNHVLIGNDGGLGGELRPGEDMGVPAEPAGRPLLSRGRRQRDAVQHLRRDAGQLQLVRSERGPRRGRYRRLPLGTMQGGDGFVALQDPTDYRIAYSESQDGNMVRIDRVTGETMSIRPMAEPRRDAAPLELGYAARHVAPRSEDHLRGANRVYRSSNRGLNWEAAGPDLTSNVNREEITTMGVKGSDVNIAKNDGIQAFATVISLAESPKRAGLMYAGTDDGISPGLARLGPVLGERDRQGAERAEGHLGLRGRAVTIRRRARSTRPSMVTARTTSKPTSTPAGISA